ncbi:MAG: 2OG-Fe(II) oxygenase [Candidatus Sericytochromatia bacterium]
MHHNEKFMSRLVFKNVFSKSECQQILSKSELIKDALLSNGVENKEVRNTHTRKISLKEDDEWIVNRVYNTVIKANNSFFQFDIQKMSPLHILEYTSGCFYDWHLDIGGNISHSTRKITSLVFLSDPSEYEGGSLEWSMNTLPDTMNLVQDIGSMIIFPSFLPHKVNPVTSGTRRVLVSWFHGDTFR